MPVEWGCTIIKGGLDNSFVVTLVLPGRIIFVSWQ